jgi:hypothetical protein
MYVTCTNDATRRLKLPWMSDPVEFASTGTAQVSQDLGERLVAELDAIEEYDNS